MKKKLPASAGRVLRLVGLARELKRISGCDPGVSLSAAKKMDADELEDRLRGFGHWWKSHCETLSQNVESAIYDALDDEANV